MKIGLDWDGTVNADPVVFGKVVKAFLDAGHDVAVVTWRCSTDEGWPDIEEIFNMWGFKLPVIYCNGKAKRDFYKADIWIDDNPASAIFSLTRPPRFESDPAKYQEDLLEVKAEGKESVVLSWDYLRT